MEAAERALLEEAVAAALADAGANADDRLAELGWLEMLGAEPDEAIAVVFDALGRVNGVATALDDVLVSALGQAPGSDVAVLLPRFGNWAPPGDMRDGRVEAVGLATGRVATARDLLVVCRAGTDVCAVTVPVAAVAASPLRGIDPDAGFFVVRVDRPAAAGVALGSGAWESGVAAAQRAVGQQMLGACRTMLAQACDHARERAQFGRPIASFQAVRHRLADAFVAAEALEATLGAAAEDRAAITAALAKATAGRTAQTVGTHCQQVLAGIGFTTDHPFHRFLKRSMLLEGLFGSADEITIDLGRRLIAARRVPTLIEL